MRRTPFLVLGDGPTTPSGLGRIATDLAAHLWAARDRLAIDLLQVGYPDLPGEEGLTEDGSIVPWPLYTFSTLSDWGRGPLERVYARFGGKPGVVLSVWDPARCLGLTGTTAPVARWGYFAVDAENMHGGISGPAGAVVEMYDRVLAYTQYGARVLQTAREGPVPHLPHGIDLAVFTPERTEAQQARTQQLMGAYVLPETIVVGCVATNMRRKDLGLFFQVLQQLRADGIPVHGWLHTNKEISDAWSVPQLAIDTDIGTALTVTLHMSDEDLAGCYARCAVTIAPGLGEGFGYPIVESLACGTPAVHVNYGGGAELTPWLVEPVAYRLEGPYALRRPVVDPLAMTAMVRGVLEQPPPDWACRTLAEQYAWPTIWPAWEAWIAEGLRTLR